MVQDVTCVALSNVPGSKHPTPTGLRLHRPRTSLYRETEVLCSGLRTDSLRLTTHGHLEESSEKEIEGSYSKGLIGC